ncbi:MAG: hypothetical protein A2Z29_02385 [Chloroflexi bacterium RBG_16_56_11]|nr:MAG: hypothetical protein A2Z29_02385 [Chloroflexi bacterium RBG_16_56_11]
MIILWIRKSQPNKPDNRAENEGGPFNKHDEAMKEFRRRHPEVDATRPKDILTPDGNLLAPVVKVTLTENVQN